MHTRHQRALDARAGGYTVATQSSQISALVATFAQQAARISELEARMSTPAGSAPADEAEAREGRRLSASPASQRTIWHGDTLHAIDDPASCGLDSELHSNTAPLTIRRTDDILSFGYSTISPVFNISSPIRVVHSVGCNSTMNHMDTLSVSGSLSVGYVDVMARMLAFARPLKMSYPTMGGDGNKVGLGSDARNVIVLQTTLGGTGMGEGTPQEDGFVIEATSASGATAASATEKTWFAVNAVGATSGIHASGYLKMIEFKVTCTSGTHLYLKPISAKNKQNYIGDATETYKYFDAGAINAMWGSGTMAAATLADTKAGALYALASVTFIII